jgi:hypothetical protein
MLCSLNKAIPVVKILKNQLICLKVNWYIYIFAGFENDRIDLRIKSKIELIYWNANYFAI